MSKSKAIAEETEDLRSATRAAHEAIKDMRGLIREMTVLRDEVKATSETVFTERMSEQVATGLAAYNDAIAKAIEEATEAVDRRFDTIASVLLGEDGEARRKGKPTLAEMATALSVVERMSE